MKLIYNISYIIAGIGAICFGLSVLKCNILNMVPGDAMKKVVFAIIGLSGLITLYSAIKYINDQETFKLSRQNLPSQGTLKPFVDMSSPDYIGIPPMPSINNDNINHSSLLSYDENGRPYMNMSSPDYVGRPPMPPML